MTIVINEFRLISRLITINNILKLIIGKFKNKYNNQDNMNIYQLNNYFYSKHTITQIKIFNKTFKTNFNNKKVDIQTI
ncbi:hypothetical protein [Candidatus Providencia siddallii]|uniref:hypothetical protein n=1 Tax=Candidatus Providencia siddallii TaxID=1715285 RepID=UPI00312CA8DD